MVEDSVQEELQRVVNSWRSKVCLGSRGGLPNLGCYIFFKKWVRKSKLGVALVTCKGKILQPSGGCPHLLRSAREGRCHERVAGCLLAKISRLDVVRCMRDGRKSSCIAFLSPSVPRSVSINISHVRHHIPFLKYEFTYEPGRKNAAKMVRTLVSYQERSQ